MREKTYHQQRVPNTLVGAFFILSFLWWNSVVGQDNFDYLPQTVPGHEVLRYDDFTLSYNEHHEQADWVAYELTMGEVALTGSRCDCFEADTSLASGSAEDNDYKASGFDRGHLAPSGDFHQSTQSNRQTFLFTNISPQSPGFNRGLWADLEGWVRTKATAFKKLYVVTGPVFMNNWGVIGYNEVTIPGYFYKVLLFFDEKGAPKTIAFLVPNLGASGQLVDYMVPVNLIETITGLDFFPALDDKIEEACESQFENKLWGL